MAFTPLAAQETNCDGWTGDDLNVLNAFWEAVTVDAVSDCLNSGADINARNERGTTPLHRVNGFNANPEVLNLLLDAGCW